MYCVKVQIISLASGEAASIFDYTRRDCLSVQDEVEQQGYWGVLTREVQMTARHSFGPSLRETGAVLC
jgi:hypothetical protein